MDMPSILQSVKHFLETTLMEFPAETLSMLTNIKDMSEDTMEIAGRIVHTTVLGYLHSSLEINMMAIGPMQSNVVFYCTQQ
jgi:hypothetical protein